MNIKKILQSKMFLTIICILLIVGILLLLPEIRGEYIKRFGVELYPQKEVAPLSELAYLQIDQRWKDEHLAQTEYTLEEQGCRTCVIAMDLQYYGYSDTPKDINDSLIMANAYTEDGLLIWYKINSAYEDIEYDYKKVFDSNKIDEDLHMGLLPIVKVRYKETGIFHWVLIVGANEEEFLILDPLETSKKPIPLSTHGKVYAYRVLTETEK